MPRKNQRTVAPRIIFVLKQNNGKGMRFSAISRDLAKQGWYHHQVPISENLKFLIKQGIVAKVKTQYALVQTREDGTKFVIAEDPNEKVIELE